MKRFMTVVPYCSGTHGSGYVRGWGPFFDVRPEEESNSVPQQGTRCRLGSNYDRFFASTVSRAFDQIEADPPVAAVAKATAAGGWAVGGNPTRRGRKRCGHRLRGSALSEPDRVLVAEDGDVHDPGQSLHAPVPVLRGQHGPAGAARSQ